MESDRELAERIIERCRYRATTHRGVSVHAKLDYPDIEKLTAMIAAHTESLRSRIAELEEERFKASRSLNRGKF